MNASLISPQWLLRAVGVLGVLFPLALTIFGGERESLSAHYHGPARDIFVGWLSMIALALAVYRGYDGGDKLCARAAAAGLLVLTYAPTGGATGLVHLAGALVFFGSIAALTWRFGYGSRPRTFRALSLGIVACIAWALLSSATGGPILMPEVGAVACFAWAWLVKSRA